MSDSSDDGRSLRKVFDTVFVKFRWQWVVNPSFAEVITRSSSEHTLLVEVVRSSLRYLFVGTAIEAVGCVEEIGDGYGVVGCVDGLVAVDYIGNIFLFPHVLCERWRSLPSAQC